MTEARRIYRLASTDINEINRLLAQIGDRLDQIEGFRDTPLAYPVGALYSTITNTNPSGHLSGTWELIGSGSLLSSSDTVYIFKRTA